MDWILEFMELNMAKHPTVLIIQGIEVSPTDLAKSLASLSYDALAQYVEALADKIWEDAQADARRKRFLLAGDLESVYSCLIKAKYCLDTAWEVCEKHMKGE